MNDSLLLSLCIPTNGVIEWVLPVLKSIYDQNCDNKLFEVIVTDNGECKEFNLAMTELKEKYKNLIYKKTNAKMFLNQIEAFKLANGKLIKFVNHRMTLCPGSLKYLIEFVYNYASQEPVVYFSNGALKLDQIKSCSSFDDYVKSLSYWSSWSGGTAMWKTDFDNMKKLSSYNDLFPHTDMIFFNKSSSEYIIDDTAIMKEIPCDITQKGNYDLFNAFAVEYPSIIENLYINNDISYDTYQIVKKENSFFVSELYLSYVIMKKPCSYNLTGYFHSMGKYYSDKEIKLKIICVLIKKFDNKITRLFSRLKTNMNNK